MTSSRVVSVFGATGLQGSGLVQALLKDGTFTPRAIVRDPTSAAALELKAQGVEVVKGDSLDKESLIAALSGSEAVFGLTVPIWPIKKDGEGPNEIVQGKNMVDAAKAAGVKFFVFSSLPNMAELSGGKYSNLQHYDQKAAVEEYLKNSGLANASIHLGGFLENFWKFGTLKKTANGFTISVPIFGPTDRQAFIWAGRDVPAAVLGLLKNYTDPSKDISGKSYPIVTANISHTELAKLTAQVLGVDVTFTTARATGMTEMDDMYACQAEHNGLYTATPVPNPALVALGVEFGTVQEFLEAEVKPRFG
ncbi:hypothetical protein C8R46DRAFT_1223684 [Mycena filopes]|nr:hypothetical protein C8R46DRAFT_1223684 [Mycena filopes]